MPTLSSVVRINANYLPAYLGIHPCLLLKRTAQR